MHICSSTHTSLAGLNQGWMNYSSAYMGSVAAADKSQSTKMDQSINLFTQDWPSHLLASMPPHITPPPIPPPFTFSLSQPASGWEISG